MVLDDRLDNELDDFVAALEVLEDDLVWTVDDDEDLVPMLELEDLVSMVELDDMETVVLDVLLARVEELDELDDFVCSELDDDDR